MRTSEHRMGYKESTEESDEWAYGDKGAATVGWYIYAPPSRNAAVARLLGLPGVYCVGIDRNSGRTFVQTDRSIDPRNHKLRYVEALPEFTKKVKELLHGFLTPEEEAESKRNLDHLMDQARRGVL